MAPEAEDWRSDINEGIVDRSIRIAVGLLLLSLLFIAPHAIWGMIGLLPLVTGVAGYCPLYALFDVSTVGTFHHVRHA